MVCTGSVAGDTGPTIILLKGKIKRAIFNDAYLVRHGLKPGSIIIMTENTFMIHDTWYKATNAIIYRYTEIPVIRDNPQWSILEFLDGFGYHKYEPRALKMQVERNILSAKEESKTSHVNQAYDQFAAKNDKKILTDTLACQRKMKHANKGIC